jgi:hypothetical protein
MVLRGFGNTPIPGEMFIPPGTVPPITDVTYAGTYPLRHYLTNPPITTPSYPANPPRATNKAPVRPFAPYDRLTNTRATTAQLGSLRGHEQMHLGALSAGAYSGAVGRVIRRLDADTGAGLRGQIVGARLHGAPPMHMHGMLGGMHGMLGAAPSTLDLSAGGKHTVFEVEAFTSSDPSVVKGQIVGRSVVLTALKAGRATIEVATVDGRRQSFPVTVTSLTPEQGMALAQQTFNQIKNITGSAPPLNIDWQDAGVLRANYDLIYPIIRKIKNTIPSGLYAGARFQSEFMLGVLNTIKNNPSIQTLREGILVYRPGITPTGGFASRVTSRETARECGRNSVSGVVFHDLYTFGKSVAVAQEILATTLKIANLAAPIVNAYLPGAGAAISKATASVEAVAGQAMVPFATDPKRLISNFGNAICIAVVGGPNAQPLASRSAAILRDKVVTSWTLYRSQAGLRGATADETLTEAQAALAELQTLDTPAAFTPAENAAFNQARAGVESTTPPLAPGGGQASGGIPGWAIALGAVTIIGGGFLLLRR